MKNYVNITTVTTLTIGLLIGRFALQPKPKVVEKIRTVQVEKIVEVENKTKKERKVEIIKPDGTKVTKTDTIEDSTTNRDTDTKSTSVSSKETSTSSVTLGLLAIKELSVDTNLEYGIVISAPIYGSMKLQALGTTDKKIGVGLGIEF